MYKNYMQLLLNHGRDVKDTLLASNMFYPSKKMEDVNDSGYKQRAKRIINGKSVELMSPLHLNLASSGRLLPSYIDLRIVLYRNPDDLILMDLTNGANGGYKVLFEDLRLYVREVELLDSVSLALEKTLASGHAMKFPIKNVQMRSFHIPAGGYQLSPTVIHNTSIPRKVIVGLVSTEAYNGLISKDPLKFSNFSLKHVSIESGGRTFPDARMDMDYDNDSFMRSFVQLYEAGGVTVIVYSEFQNLLSIDGNRAVTIDTSV
uniref:Glyco_hydro_18 domain-containing protein n=1 Tax=Steinernema glaseri TaxID=37863 RepID=A0A1I8ANJ8_9BILA